MMGGTWPRFLASCFGPRCVSPLTLKAKLENRSKLTPDLLLGPQIIWMDGRYFRDEWTGPYGDCSTSDLELIGENCGMFLMPSAVISDYVPLKRDYWSY
jgi:hypothetical protein